MPKITKISRQQRRQDRYSVYVDGSYRFSLSEPQLVAAALRSGDEISAEQLDELMQASDFGKALDRAYNYISYRIRSRHEVVVYLKGHYDETVASAVADDLERRGIIDDAHFAAEWIENRNLLNPRSAVQLRAELRQKGIAPEVIDEALEGFDRESEVATVRALIAQRGLERRYPDERKLMQHLSSKGFRYDTIKAALEQLTDENQP